MPGKNYPSDRVAQKSYESGPVKSGLPAVKQGGKEHVETKRAGKSK